jgi:hypothetical protein
MSRAMDKWRVSYFGKKGEPLGTVEAADAVAACKKAIDFYDIEPAQQFRVVAVQLGPAKKPARAKVGAKS